MVGWALVGDGFEDGCEGERGKEEEKGSEGLRRSVNGNMNEVPCMIERRKQEDWYSHKPYVSVLVQKRVYSARGGSVCSR